MDRAIRVLDHSVIALAVLLGAGSIALFAWEGRPVFVRMGLAAPAALAWDALLSLVFFAQHSGMVRRSFRARVVAVIPQRYDVAVYAIGSGLALMLVVVFWQPVVPILFELTGVPRLIAVACTLLAVATFVLSAHALRTFDPLGLRPIRAHLHGTPDRPSPFVLRGPYRWVRHPLYACVLVLLWARPEMTADDLLLAVMWSAWIVMGTVLEERDMVDAFGDTYRRYQRQVPMLIPWRRPAAIDATVPASGPG